MLPERSSTDLSRGRLVYGNVETVRSSAWDLGPFVSNVISASDRGRWVKYGYHVKYATSISARNGEFDLWKNGVRIAHNTGVPIAHWAGAFPNGYFELPAGPTAGSTDDGVLHGRREGLYDESRLVGAGGAHLRGLTSGRPSGTDRVLRDGCCLFAVNEPPRARDLTARRRLTPGELVDDHTQLAPNGPRDRRDDLDRDAHLVTDP